MSGSDSGGVLQHIISSSPQETMSAGESFARLYLHRGDVVLLSGDLGAGKTVFTKGIAHTFGIPADEVTSPTFSLVNEYDVHFPDGVGKLFHLDCYRFEHPDELIELGLDYLHPTDGITVVEWYERLGKYIPTDAYYVDIEELTADKRSITIRR